ncbi:hypothetical protein HK100_009515 [Physocladia obscura]|uniref:SAM domain-containing protein n=1 Tax=Physocladia obscura TaxID=109957 RepID=A0AAD5X9P7_9FUNG|nr:hypothetical protein HK100_009515 [Physocladia obscura]
MSLYTGGFNAFSNVTGGYASGCQYEGTVLKMFGVDENVVNCGPHCQNNTVTLGCFYFTFVGNNTGADSYGTCFLYGKGAQTLGPYTASVNDVCGYFGSSATPSATTASSASKTLASTSTGIVTVSESFTRTDTSSINNSNSTSNSSSGGNTGAIVGGVIGALVVVGLAVLGFVWWTRRQNRANQNKQYVGKPSINPPPNQNSNHYQQQYNSYQLQPTNTFTIANTNNSTPAPTLKNSDPSSHSNPSSQSSHPSKQHFGATAGTIPEAKFNLFNSINDRNHGDSFTTTAPELWSVAETIAWLESIAQSDLTVELFRKHGCDGRFLKAVAADRQTCNSFLREDLGIADVRERAILVDEVVRIFGAKGVVVLDLKNREFMEKLASPPEYEG